MTRDTRLSGVGAEIVGALQGFLEALEGGGDLSQRYTIRTVELELKPREYGAAEVRKIRDQLGLSQPLFARFLGVSTQTVRAWEQGTKSPSGMACRFLDEISLSPEHWRERLKTIVRVRGKEKANGRNRHGCTL